MAGCYSPWPLSSFSAVLGPPIAISSFTFSFSYSSSINFIPTFFRVSSSGNEPPVSRIYFSSIRICFLSASIFSSDFSKSLFNSATVYSLLTLGAFLIFLALAPNLRVLNVSASLNGCGEHVIISNVFELPPSDSDNILVSFDSLYGICCALLSVRATITFPRVERL